MEKIMGFIFIELMKGNFVKRYNIKLIIFILLAVFLLGVLSGCGSGSGGGGSSGGSGGGSSPHVPDTTPHDYTIAFYMLTDTSQVHTGTLRQICDNGYPQFRDEIVDYTFQNANNSGGMGCAGARNVILTAQNTGAYELYVVISIDGVNQPQQILQPGQTLNFTRGY